MSSPTDLHSCQVNFRFLLNDDLFISNSPGTLKPLEYKELISQRVSLLTYLLSLLVSSKSNTQREKIVKSFPRRGRVKIHVAVDRGQVYNEG